MKPFDFIQIFVTLVPVLILTPVLGGFMARVFQGEKNIFSKALLPLETGLYRLTGVEVQKSMDWKQYAVSLLFFNFLGFVFLFALQIFQHLLPLNPQGLSAVPWPLAFNTAMSFVTNTNWQAYAGETTMSYLTQMTGLCVQNFLSAATGITVLLALTRGIKAKESTSLGNFWVDITRSILYVLLPLSILYTVLLVSQGVVQTFGSYVTATTLEGANQILPLGPAASQIAIKQLGTNGGGFFNANSSHPFENPTPFSNWLQMVALILIPAALTYTYGVMVKDRRQGWVLFGVMAALLIGALSVSLYFEPSFFMEGKETRFGVTNSILWSVLTTASSNGSVNAMHSSLSPLSGGVALLNILLGEIVFGGVGSGLYGILLFVLLTVFLAGLMVGRSPEYLGKKIEAKEIQMVILAILAPCVLILVGAGVSAVLPVALSSLLSKGPHGLSEILYAFSSASGNNGSAFAGLNANTTYYNIALGICMLLGRFAVILPCLVIAGNFAKKKSTPISFGTFTTDNGLFACLLIAVILIVGALTFFPVLALGPIIEHFLGIQGWKI